MLKNWSDLYVEQIDQSLTSVAKKLGTKEKEVVLKEIGFASRELGFLRPFEYTRTGPEKVNIDHQAAAYEAILKSFWQSGLDWFKGIVWWDVSVNESLHGPTDHGFSPLGKERTEQILKAHW